MSTVWLELRGEPERRGAACATVQVMKSGGDAATVHWLNVLAQTCGTGNQSVCDRTVFAADIARTWSIVWLCTVPCAAAPKSDSPACDSRNDCGL